MDLIEEYREQIQSDLENLHKTIHLSPLFTSDQKKWKESCSKHFSQIKKKIQCLEEEVNELPTSKVSHHHIYCKQYSKKLKSYEEQCRERIRGDSTLQQLQSKNKKQNNATLELIQKGDDTQGRIKELLVSMDGTVEEGIKQALLINEELLGQIEQLGRIEDKVKDTKSNLKRAKKSINYFLKALECDKCMMGLLLLNALALIAVIVLLVKQNV